MKNPVNFKAITLQSNKMCGPRTQRLLEAHEGWYRVSFAATRIAVVLDRPKAFNTDFTNLSALRYIAHSPWCTIVVKENGKYWEVNSTADE